MAKKEMFQIKTLDEFIRCAQQLVPEEYLFRGVPNQSYEIEASAYRRLGSEEDLSLEKFLEINEELIKDARLRGHDLKNGRVLSDLEMLAELQHFRAATCLIDFTYNALVALWFACQTSSMDKSDGKVVAVRNNPSRFKEITPELLTNKIDYFLQDNEDGRSQLYQWQPRQQNNRIIAQQSIFLFGGVKIEADAEWIIQESSKQSILTSLQLISGIAEGTLFPDFDGFARLRSHHVPYIQLSASYYIERGSWAHQKSEYEAALVDYDTAIQLDPNYTHAYFNRGILTIDMGRYPDALANFDKVIALDPNYLDAYINRGNVKDLLGQLEEALIDYDTAIQLNPDHATAYYHRGNIQAKLGRTDKANEDLREALQQAARVGDAKLIVRIGQRLQDIESGTEK